MVREVGLGRQLERSLRLGLNLTDGDWIRFLERPYTALFVAVTITFLAVGIYRQMRLRRRLRALQQNGTADANGAA